MKKIENEIAKITAWLGGIMAVAVITAIIAPPAAPLI